MKNRNSFSGKTACSVGITGIIAALVLSLSASSFAAEPVAAPAATPVATANGTTAAPANATTAAPAIAATESDAAAVPPDASGVAKESMENPYGLEALWKGGDFIARATLFILAFMSMGSWYILITKFIDQLKLGRQARDARNSFWNAASVQAGVATLEEGSPYRFIAETSSKASEHHEGSLLEKIDLNEWVIMSLQRAVEKVQSRLQDGLAFLATVGSTAPFVGLFGTVWGIYGALTKIGIAGQASIDKVAGPVGEALIMTAFGLAVAVPAVLGYNFLVRRNKKAMEDVRAFSADLHLVLISGAMATSEAGRATSTKKVG